MNLGKPGWWDQACAELTANDPVLARLIASYPGISLEGRGDVFLTLARSVVGQQISVKAADSIWRRVVEAVGAMESRRVLAADPLALRACGLSQRKVEYLTDLARHHADGRLDRELLAGLDDEALIGALTDIRGIGRWTAEMFMMFHLLRPNVLPLDDIGIVRAIALLYHGGERLPKAEIRRLAEPWQPWCTAASWYLWRSLEPTPVSY
ncbi:DNA-3-methyladenine glycosylase family protein [Chitinolyticbacter meiyuanensis]|uniref:DNA-3-methyladenine glycosylase family protein n=1 Tax=Chitinolyticbacter meiyuanensis TaxID=682798 RepID=UPI0011E59DC5|nr:DNA-3-methyladenine glycosylase [Chitinolyticbacter meiyuanensis]